MEIRSFYRLDSLLKGKIFSDLVDNIEAFEKCSILSKIKPPACRAYAPEGKAKILTTGIHLVFRGLQFEPDPREIGFAFHGAGTEIG